MNNLEKKERIEIDFWNESKTENPGEFTIENLVNKVGDAEVFLSLLERYNSHFLNANKILELGGGQGWASCIIKKKFNKYTILSDISPFAVESVKYWEDIYKVKIDASFACRSYQIPLADKSVDLIFCYAAAHHFVEHEKTLAEIERVLAIGGKCLYMYEPSCKPYVYKIAKKRVNKKRPEVPEDLLIINNMIEIATKYNLKVTVEYFPSILKRKLFGTFYYSFLSKFFFLNKILPSTVNLIFEKNKNGGN